MEFCQNRALCVTTLCCDHFHAQGAVSKAFNKEELVEWGATSAEQKSFSVLSERTTFSPAMSLAVKLLHLARTLN